MKKKIMIPALAAAVLGIVGAVAAVLCRRRVAD